MDDEAESCGRELASSADVPESIGVLMRHVALNLEAHARWVGVGSDATRSEHDAMLRVAGEYRAIATAADAAATTMRSFRDLDSAPHDATRFDRAGFAAWMRTKIELQKKLATMLMEHAAASEKALAQLE